MNDPSTVSHVAEDGDQAARNKVTVDNNSSRRFEAFAKKHKKEKLTRRAMANRKSAKRSWERSKLLLSTLEETVIALRMESHSLKQEKRQLEFQLQDFKHQLKLATTTDSSKVPPPSLEPGASLSVQKLSGAPAGAPTPGDRHALLYSSQEDSPHHQQQRMMELLQHFARLDRHQHALFSPFNIDAFNTGKERRLRGCQMLSAPGDCTHQQNFGGRDLPHITTTTLDSSASRRLALLQHQEYYHRQRDSLLLTNLRSFL